MPAGRPTKYKPAYCDLLLEHMRSGLSYTTFADVIDVNPDTLYQWEKDYPDFSETKKRAFIGCLHFWEKVGIQGLWSTTETTISGKERTTTSKSLNAPTWIYSMRCRFKEHGWNEGKASLSEDDKSRKTPKRLVIQMEDDE